MSGKILSPTIAPNTILDYYTESDILTIVRDHIDGFGSQKAFAEYCGISEQFLSDILLGRRKPSQKILDRIHLKAVTVYVSEHWEVQ